MSYYYYGESLLKQNNEESSAILQNFVNTIESKEYMGSVGWSVYNLILKDILNTAKRDYETMIKNESNNNNNNMSKKIDYPLSFETDILGFFKSIIGGRGVFPKQPLIDGMIEASIELKDFKAGFDFIQLCFNDPDKSIHTLPNLKCLLNFMFQLLQNQVILLYFIFFSFCFFHCYLLCVCVV